MLANANMGVLFRNRLPSNEIKTTDKTIVMLTPGERSACKIGADIRG